MSELSDKPAHPTEQPYTQLPTSLLHHAGLELSIRLLATTSSDLTGAVSSHVILRESAVTVLLFRRDDDIVCVATKRAQHLRSFPGAFVFPGGKADPGETIAETARRELSEELGVYLPRSHFDQPMPLLFHRSGEATYFAITPFIVALPYQPVFHPNLDEVEKVELIPLGLCRHDSSPPAEASLLKDGTRLIYDALREALMRSKEEILGQARSSAINLDREAISLRRAMN